MERRKEIVGNCQFAPNRSLIKLDPGRPSAGGHRMDRRAVTSLGVVKISRLALRLRRSAQRGPKPTSVLIKILGKHTNTNMLTMGS